MRLFCDANLVLKYSLHLQNYPINLMTFYFQEEKNKETLYNKTLSFLEIFSLLAKQFKLHFIS